MAEKSPAYLWYPGDILSSGNVAELTASEECWYRRGLDFAWKDGGVPSDPEKFAKRIGKGCTKSAAAKILKTFFEPDRKNAEISTNKKQEKIRKEYADFRKKKSEAGKKGMEKRWKSNDHKSSGDNGVNNTAITQGITKHNSSSSLSSSLSKEGGRGVRTPAGGQTPTPPTDLKKPEKPKALGTNPAVTLYEEIFGPPKLELATSIAMTVKDLGLWHDLLTEKAGWSNPEKWIIKAYRERVAQSPAKDPDQPPGRVKTAREINAEERAKEEQWAREAAEAKRQGNETTETDEPET